MDQMRPYVDDGLPVEMITHPTPHHEMKHGEIKGHRVNEKGNHEFLMQYDDLPPSEAAWIPASDLLEEGAEPLVKKYCDQQGLQYTMNDLRQQSS